MKLPNRGRWQKHWLQLVWEGLALLASPCFFPCCSWSSASAFQLGSVGVYRKHNKTTLLGLCFKGDASRWAGCWHSPTSSLPEETDLQNNLLGALSGVAGGAAGQLGHLRGAGWYCRDSSLLEQQLEGRQEAWGHLNCSRHLHFSSWIPHQTYQEAQINKTFSLQCLYVCTPPLLSCLLYACCSDSRVFKTELHPRCHSFAEAFILHSVHGGSGVSSGHLTWL